MNNKVQTIIIFPYLRVMNSIKIGSITIKGYEDFIKESQRTKQDLARVTTFFRQKETRPLDAFGYIVKNSTEEALKLWLIRLRRYITIMRFLSSTPDNRGLHYENLTPYLVYPEKSNPRTFKHNNEPKDYYMYRIHKNISKDYQFLSYPHSVDRPYYVENVYSEMLNHYDLKLEKDLTTKVREKEQKAMDWYAKSFSANIDDPKLKLMFLSIAFECLLEDSKFKNPVEKAIKAILKKHVNEDIKLKEIMGEITPYIGSKITDTLATKIETLTGSENLKKWFKKAFYPASSGIRHTGNINEVPLPVTNSKDRNRRSIYYAGNASHEFVSNIYIAQRVFRFLVEEKLSPQSEYIRAFQLNTLNNLLVADEERLKEIKQRIDNKKVGKIKYSDLDIVFSLSHSFTGNKLIIFEILKRLLIELKEINKVTWDKVSEFGEQIINTNISEEDLTNYSKNDIVVKPLIELDSILYREKDTVAYTPKNMITFNIRTFVGYATHQLV